MWSGSRVVLSRLRVQSYLTSKRTVSQRALLSSTSAVPVDPVAIDTSLPSVLAVNEAILLGMHSTGVPWWLTVVSSTLVLRSCLTLPIAVYQQRSLGKMVELAPMVQSWAETLKNGVGQRSREQGLGYEGYQAQLQKEYKKKVKAIYAHYGCSRWKLLLLPYVQIPLFVSMSLTLRHLTAYPLPWYGQTASQAAEGLSEGGLGFFSDLTATDTTWILPVLVGVGNLTNVELNVLFAKGVRTRQQEIMTHLFRGLSLAFIPIAAQAPTAISLYWVTSAWYSVAQNLTFRIPRVRSLLGMPQLPEIKPPI